MSSAHWRLIPLLGSAPPVSSRIARFWEIDALRGFAFILMVSYHTAFDLAVFGGWPIPVTSGGWRLYANFIASSFLFLSGISLVLARLRWSGDRRAYSTHLWRRFSRLAMAAVLVSLVTWLVSPADVVLFGILHLILVSDLLALPLLRLGIWNVLCALCAWLLGVVVTMFPGHPWFFWLGFVPEGYRSFDFRPLFPWAGVVFAGVAVGSWLYQDGVRRFGLPDWSEQVLIRVLRWCGRRSLLLYLTHQPVILLILTAVGLVDLHALGV